MKKILLIILISIIYPATVTATSGDILGIYPVGMDPDHVIFDPSTNSIWVANYSSNNVTKLRASDGAVIGTYATGVGPSSLAFDSSSNSIWVSNYGYPTPNTIRKIRASDGATIGTYGNTGVSKLTYDPSTNSVWTTNYGQDKISKVNANTGAVVATYAALGPSSITYDPSTNSIWYSNGRYQGTTHQIRKLNISSGVITGMYLGAFNNSWAAFDSSTNSMWLPFRNSNNIYKYRTSDGYVSGVYAVGTAPSGVAFDSLTNSIWVANYSSNNVMKLRASDGVILGTYSIPTPAGVVFDPSTNSIWVTSRTSKVYKLAVQDTGTVAVSSNIAASWTISGPSTISGSGTTGTYPSRKTGTYTITWGAVSGYTTPATQSLSLSDGATITFSGNYVVTNTAPAAPTISGPTTTTTGTAQTYSFVATDPQGNQIRYGIDWDMNGVADEWLPSGVAYVNSGTSRSTTHSWATTGTKTFRALAQDTYGLNSSWSSTYTVTVTSPNTAPVAPTVSGPVTTPINTVQTYSFVATDPESNQIRYGVDWDMNGVADVWVPAGVTYVNSGTQQSTTYSWTTSGAKTFQVLAQDTWGLNSAWRTYNVTVTVPTCANGTNNYPTCTQCPDNQAYLLTNCVDCSGTGGCTGVPGGTVSDPTGGLVCNNGALTPAYCSDCAEGMYYTGNSCIACSNGGCSGSGVTLVCNNGSIDPPACITPAPPTCNNDNICGTGETVQSCSQDCNPRYEQF